MSHKTTTEEPTHVPKPTYGEVEVLQPIPKPTNGEVEVLRPIPKKSKQN